ncbi:MAG: hypothetical protein HYX60_10335, partial [Legionella longbeachae]|nr:hypothetical protein [Legionella longbeachae]
MGWRDTFWAASSWTLDTVIHITADTMTYCGSLVCTLGGVAFAVAEIIAQQDVNTSYYGSIRAVGNFTLGLTITNMNYSFNTSLPFIYKDQTNNGNSYSLTDYIRPEFVRIAGVVCITSGTTLRIFGANINKWQQYRKDKRYYQAHEGIEISPPQLKEYLYVSAKSISGSLSNAVLSNTVTAGLLSLSGAKFPNVNYPPYGNESVAGPYYNGPVISTPFPINMSLDDSNVTIPSPFGNLDVLLKKAINGVANATYGGDFFFKRKEVTQNSNHAVFVIK